MNKYDSIDHYCRMLGHPVSFKYCRGSKDGLPCGKIMDCWFERIPIEDYIMNYYSEEEIEEILRPSKAKILSLVELIEKAKTAK